MPARQLQVGPGPVPAAIGGGAAPVTRPTPATTITTYSNALQAQGGIAADAPRRRLLENITSWGVEVFVQMGLLLKKYNTPDEYFHSP